MELSCAQWDITKFVFEKVVCGKSVVVTFLSDTEKIGGVFEQKKVVLSLQLHIYCYAKFWGWKSRAFSKRLNPLGNLHSHPKPSN